MIRIDFLTGTTTTAASVAAALADVRRWYPAACFYTNGGPRDGYCVVAPMAGDEHELRQDRTACIEAWAPRVTSAPPTDPRQRVAVLRWEDATAEQLRLW
jgi:hypothetical protein